MAVQEGAGNICICTSRQTEFAITILRGLRQDAGVNSVS